MVKIQSKTKFKLSQEDINNITNFHFNETPKSYKELVSGFYATIYKIELEDTYVVLKVSPINKDSLLTYEEDIMRREVKVYQLLKEHTIPVPNIIISNFNKDIIQSDYYIMEFLQGDTLFNVKDTISNKDEIYIDIMKNLAHIHNIKTPHFGYDNLIKKHSKMSNTYLLMIDNLLEDAKRKNITLDYHSESIIGLLPSLAFELDTITEPRLLHFDLWEGNIFIHQNKLSAFIDTERSLNGDPVSEFAAMHMDIFDASNSEKLENYNKYRDIPLLATKNNITKFKLYQFYMYLLMYIESFYRDVEGSYLDQRNWCLSEFKRLYNYFNK